LSEKFRIFRKVLKPDYHGLGDKELLDLYNKSSDKEIIGVLYKRYSHLVFGVCLKYLKEKDSSKDAVIDIFEKLLNDLSNHNIDNFKAWLYMVARNHCLMILRKIKHEYTVDEPSLLIKTNNDMEIDDEQHHLDIYDNNMLKNAIDELKDEQKVCIELFYLNNKSYQEITEITGFDNSKVKSYIQNGKRNLKILLTRNNNE